jgi:hypothetical protein
MGTVTVQFSAVQFSAVQFSPVQFSPVHVIKLRPQLQYDMHTGRIDA